MKKFKDLEFKNHPNSWYGFDTQARMDFKNGYWVSVVTWSAAHSNSTKPYELAVMKKWDICYSSWITDDVIWHLNEKGVTKYMIKVQKLNDTN